MRVLNILEIIPNCLPLPVCRYNNRAKIIKRKLVADDRLKSDSMGRNVAELKAEEKRKLDDLKRKRLRTAQMVEA